MVLTGALAEQAGSEDAFDLSAYPGGGQVTFNGNIPEHGFYHQFGAVRSKGGVLPRRAFIGLSASAQAEIIAEFDAWVGMVIGEGWGGGSGTGPTHPLSIFTHPSGRRQYRVGGWWGPNV
jgi:hypothetical protein